MSNRLQILILIILGLLAFWWIKRARKSYNSPIINASLPVSRHITFTLNKEKYVISCLTLKDTAELYKVTMQEKGHLRKTLPWLDTIQKEDDTKKFITESENLINAGDSIRMGIKNDVMGSGIIGVISIDNINSEKPMIGYWLCQKWEGKGIVTTALSKLIEEAFKVTHIKCLYIYAEPNNHKSKAVAQRLNFSYEGTVKEAEDMYGTLVDQDIFLKRKS